MDRRGRRRDNRTGKDRPLPPLLARVNGQIEVGTLPKLVIQLAGEVYVPA